MQVDHTTKIAVLFRMCTTMAAEVVGVSVFLGILDLVLGEKSQYGGRNASTLSKRFCIVNDASSVVHVNCSAGRRRARTKFGGTCFRSLCSQYLFQNPCSGICSQPQCSQAACTEGLRLPKKSGGKRTRSLMKKEGEWSWHAPMRRQKVSEEVS